MTKWPVQKQTHKTAQITQNTKTQHALNNYFIFMFHQTLISLKVVWKHNSIKQFSRVSKTTYTPGIFNPDSFR